MAPAPLCEIDRIRIRISIEDIPSHARFGGINFSSHAIIRHTLKSTFRLSRQKVFPLENAFLSFRKKRPSKILVVIPLIRHCSDVGTFWYEIYIFAPLKKIILHFVFVNKIWTFVT